MAEIAVDMSHPADAEDGVAGACHCGAVRFRVRLRDGLRTARRCTCSYCRMRGAVVLSAALDDFRISAGGEHLTEYRFHTRTARHWFCSRCGIYTHHRRRSSPDQIGVNLACLDGLSPFDCAEVPVHNGIEHPSDVPEAPRLAGTLYFVPMLEQPPLASRAADDIREQSKS